MQVPLWLTDTINLFFPNVCQACGNALISQEEVICLTCQFKLPKTGFHQHEENIVSRIFWGRVNINSATSFLFFNKGGNVQQLMHALKYKSNKGVGVYLGKLFGRELAQSPLFNSVDLIVPVPLHPKKYHQRGFNQSQVIASGISQAMNKPLDNQILVRHIHTSSQTKKSRYDRWENVRNAFGIMYPDKFCNRHILLVDDVLTTGATLEACASVLLEVEGTRVSVATLGYAQV